MKPFSLIIILCLLLPLQAILAQNEVDALRYSRTFPVGTAKSVAMGGAMGAVGGDFTSLSINPAGIGLYRASEMTISPSIYWNTSKSNFLGEENRDEVYSFHLGNIGFVFNNDFGNETGWISTSFGFGYNRLGNFSNDTYMRGTNNNNSFLDNFVNYANAYPNNFDPFYEQLAYDVDLLPYDEGLGEYWNDIQNSGYGQVQERLVKTRGSIGEYVFSYGANYNHKLYIGATLGINRLNYEQNIIHIESDPTNIIPVFDSFRFEEYLLTTGTGYSLKFGILGRPVEYIRLGAAFHLPTFYYLRDSYENNMDSYFDADANLDNKSANTGLNEYQYRLRTPFKAIGSAAFQIGKLGMISVDYEFVDYKRANLEASDDAFYTENNTIEDIYKASSNIKLGGELKLGDIYLRAGYGFYGSPYATSEPNIDANRSVISGGFGIRGRFFFIDAGYSYSSEEMNYYMYVPEMTAGSLNKSMGNTAQVTLGFRF